MGKSPKIKILKIAEEDTELAKSLKMYLKYVKDYRTEDLEELNIEKLMEDFSKRSIKKANEEKYLIVLNGISRDGENTLWNEGFPNDPFLFPLCDFLLSVIFDDYFYEGDKNWFLSNTLFVGYCPPRFIENYGSIINCIQLPCELLSLSKRVDELENVQIDEDTRNKIWESMRESMLEAFKLHGAKH